MAFVYIVRCADGTYYTGTAGDLDRRLDQHNSGRGAKYTRGRRPVQLVYWEQMDTIGKALSREKQIQRMPRSKKIVLVQSFQNDPAAPPHPTSD